MTGQKEHSLKRRLEEDLGDAQPPKKKRRTSRELPPSLISADTAPLPKSPPEENAVVETKEKEEEPPPAPATDPDQPQPSLETGDPPPATETDETQAVVETPMKSPKEKKPKQSVSKARKRLRFKKNKPTTTPLERRLYNHRHLEIFRENNHRMIVVDPPPGVKPSFKFNVGDRVLCWYGRKTQYEASILGRLADWNPSRENFDIEYRVHFIGWKSNWDMWTEEDHLDEITDEKKAMAAQNRRERKVAHDKLKYKKQVETSSDDDSDTVLEDPNATSLAKRQAEKSWIEMEFRQLKLKGLQSRIQEKYRLASDMNRVVRVPAEEGKTVLDIFEDFLKSKAVTDRNDCDRRQYYQLISNMMNLFDRMALTRCIVETEEAYVRQKQAETNLSPKQLLGLDHLLRFFCAFGPLLCQAKLDPVRHKQIIKKANAFVWWVVKKLNKYSKIEDEYDDLVPVSSDES